MAIKVWSPSGPKATVDAVNANSESDSLVGQGTDTHCEVCPLNRVKTGIAVRVRQLRVAPEIRDHLREIGLGEDQIVRLITNQTNFICQVCNSRLAISEQLASLILVEPVRVKIS